MGSSPTDPSRLVEVTMPQMGVSVAEGTVSAWRKRPGDWIERDEVIVEISTDKVETEVPSPAAGRMREILVQEGVTVDVGTLLATLDADARPGEAHADEHGPDAAPAAVGGPAAAHAATGQAAATDVGATIGKPAGASGGTGGAGVSPVVRRIAAEHAIDLARVRGSGRGGRVTKRDVLALVDGAPEGPAGEVGLGAEGSADFGGRRLSLMRRQIGEHMVRSLHTAAHCTTIVEADMSAVEAARGRLSYLPYVARAVIAALREHPVLNATLEGETLTVHPGVNLGVAVALGDDGLIVPVIRDAHELSLEGLARSVVDLAERARSKRLLPEEVEGGTFTITNPGRFGALLATPIINQPQVAILDLEAVTKRPVVVTDEQGRDSIAIRPMAYLCMSWDHRALDGVLAARFLGAVRSHLEGWPSA